MQRLVIIGAAALVLGFGVWAGHNRVEAGPATGPTPSDRLAALEHKMANLEKIVGMPLDDDVAIRAIFRKQQQAMAMAKGSSLVSQLQTMRSQLELYQVQHIGVYPDLARGWDQLVNGTDSKGRIFRSGEDGPGVMGPYLRRSAVNPFTESDRVVSSDEAIGPDVGWIYHQKTGELKAVISKSDARKYQLAPLDVVTY